MYTFPYLAKQLRFWQKLESNSTGPLVSSARVLQNFHSASIKQVNCKVNTKKVKETGEKQPIYK
jgi:hypothetical protein